MEQKRTRWLLDDLVDAFERHLEALCGVSNATKHNYSKHSREFLERRFKKGVVDVEQLRSRDLVKFVSDRSSGCKPRTTQNIATSLRGFLRFLQFHGLCDARLIEAVPTVPAWRHAGLPLGLADEQVAGLLNSFDQTKPIGLRNRAMALCLVELGLRAGEVARLSIDDLNWRSGTLQVVAGKSGRANSLPLTESVGRAIALYLHKGRPETNERRIFVSHAPPRGEPISSNAVSRVIRGAFHRAAIDAPHKGSHILRHTAATRMIRRGASIKEIADVLGHLNLETTNIYAKVDLPMLSEVAMPFPEMQ